MSKRRKTLLDISRHMFQCFGSGVPFILEGDELALLCSHWGDPEAIPFAYFIPQDDLDMLGYSVQLTDAEALGIASTLRLGAFESFSGDLELALQELPSHSLSHTKE